MPADHRQSRIVFETLPRPVGEPRPDAVVAAQSIAAGKQKTSGLGGRHDFIVLVIGM
jgi:hypothetical protein